MAARKPPPPVVVYIHWDDTHTSPPIGPFLGVTAAKKEITKFRKLWDEVIPEKKIPKTSYSYILSGSVCDFVRPLKKREPPPKPSNEMERLPMWAMNSVLLEFYQTLEPEQEVKWREHPNATYTLVTGKILYNPEDSWLSRYARTIGWVKAKRKSGTVVWIPLIQLKPLTWTPPPMVNR